MPKTLGDSALAFAPADGAGSDSRMPPIAVVELGLLILFRAAPAGAGCLVQCALDLAVGFQDDTGGYVAGVDVGLLFVLEGACPGFVVGRVDADLGDAAGDPFGDRGCQEAVDHPLGVDVSTVGGIGSVFEEGLQPFALIPDHVVGEQRFAGVGIQKAPLDSDRGV